MVETRAASRWRVRRPTRGWGRWTGWLAASVVSGLVLGFLVGLTKPRPKLA